MDLIASARCFAHSHPSSDGTLSFKQIALHQYNGSFAFMVAMWLTAAILLICERHHAANHGHSSSDERPTVEHLKDKVNMLFVMHGYELKFVEKHV